MKRLSQLGFFLLVACAMALAGCDDDDGGIDGGGVDSGTGDAGPPAATCDDGEQNQDETDVDCGGACGATCMVGEMCAVAGDCGSGICEMGACMAMPSCDDGVQNGMETDVDCGGMGCPACVNGELCSVDTDCESGFCDAGECVAPTCGNGVVEGAAEDCDEGAGGTPAETATCDVDCTAVMCGDGITNMTAGEACDGDGMGTGGESATCNTDCTAAACGDGQVNTTAGENCDEGSGGTPLETMTCDVDCTTAMCGDMVVNNAAGEQCDDGNMDDTDACTNTCQVNGQSLSIGLNATFNTDTGELDGVVNPGWVASTNTLFVSDFALASGVILTVTGSNAFHVVASGNVDISGTIEASGQDGTGGVACDAPGAVGGAGGPGGGVGGNGGGFMLLTIDGAAGAGTGGGAGGIADNAGGGGGGHIAVGSDGTVGTTTTGMTGVGGARYTGLGSFEGGSGGGGGSVDDDAPAGIDTGDDGGGGGGGGGGAVVFESSANIIVTGSIEASGGDGGDDGCSAGGGGGGSGGTIILWSSATVDVSMATLTVDGGAGGAGGASGGDGAAGEISIGARPTCTDGVQNGDETDLDCGGTFCGGCGLTLGCRIDSDCIMTGACVGGFCVAATCTNMVTDVMETDVDCGGPECAPCADTLACTAATDCISGVCTAGTCQAPTCTDGVQNQDESDVDCGGATCAGCAATLACAAPSDCASGVCTANVCQAPTCMDGVVNGGETDVDCGGSTACPRCADFDICTAPTDCTSAACTMGRCGTTGCIPFPGTSTDPFGYFGCTIPFTPATLPCPDISATGTVGPTTDDGTASVPIGFSFDFYGVTYTNATISSNGALVIDGTSIGFTNQCLPAATSPAGFIAPFWDDLFPPGAGDVRYQTLGTAPNRQFVVRWNVPHISGIADTLDVTLVLNETSNDIEVCYADVDFADPIVDNGASATVGILGSAVNQLQFSCNTASLSDGLYVQYVAP